MCTENSKQKLYFHRKNFGLKLLEHTNFISSMDTHTLTHQQTDTNTPTNHRKSIDYWMELNFRIESERESERNQNQNL